MWEAPGRCADCNSALVCPFRQNAEWLREPTRRDAISRILRHGELATGQRWNFRDAFSLAAELLVGEWDDLDGNDHPCKWVHGHAAMGGTAPSPETIGHAYHLLSRLYPHALFPTNWLRATAERLESQIQHFVNEPFSEAFVQELGYDPGKHPKPIREKLLKDYVRFDPAAYTPASTTHVLHQIETEYSQSVVVGNDVPRDPALAAPEVRYLECLKEAEGEWDLLGRDSAVATKFVHLLRRVACILVKRSVGVRLGHHAFEADLEEFSATLRNQQKLNLLKDALQEILGKDRFRFNLVESYGQPAAEEDKLVVLDGPKPGLRTYIAPSPSPTAPAHDVPSFTIGSNLTYRIPITFDFFLALTLRAAGCANSSLPASVRAAIDRVRHRYAGELCRSKSAFADGTAQIVLGGKLAIRLPDEDSPPRSPHFERRYSSWRSLNSSPSLRSTHYLPKRLIPSDAVLEAAYRRALAVAAINHAIEDVREEAIAAAEEAVVPKTLRRQVQAAMKTSPEAWDRALYAMAKSKLDRGVDE